MHLMKTADFLFLDIPGSPIKVTGRNLAFTVQPERGLDISSLYFKGIPIAYNAPDEIAPSSCFSYREGDFQRGMVFGLLTTCGLENAGPDQLSETGEYWSKHGSLNYSPAVNVTAEKTDEGVRICGEIAGNRFSKHHFNLHRTISFNDEEDKISVIDDVYNPGEDDQICIMYHYNVGAPFLSPSCKLFIPDRNVIPKNEDAAGFLSDLMNVSAPSEDQKPHVFYTDNSYAELINDELGLTFILSSDSSTLPKMDIWKNLRPELYVMSLEPCNAFPYGRLTQRNRGNYKLLRNGEHIEYRTEIRIKEN